LQVIKFNDLVNALQKCPFCDIQTVFATLEPGIERLKNFDPVMPSAKHKVGYEKEQPMFRNCGAKLMKIC
jgi:hypothetical protein